MKLQSGERKKTNCEEEKIRNGKWGMREGEKDRSAERSQVRRRVTVFLLLLSNTSESMLGTGQVKS